MNIPIFLKKIEPQLLSLEIYVSDRKNKKYYTKIKGRKVYFGDSRYGQYQDKTPIKKYSKSDHNNKDRRRLFYIRHNKSISDSIAKNEITPSILSAYFLW